MIRSVVIALVVTAIALGPGVSTAAPAPAPSVASAPSSAAAPTGNATESFVTLNVNPWVAGKIYAPVSVPTGSSIEFVWSGAHGVYLLSSSQCPTNYTAGANMLYNISSATSVNNNYTATLTQPGIYYFSCPVRSSVHRLGSYHSLCSNACGNVCDLCRVPPMCTAICCCCSTACVN
ncbi:TPA: hypothetical protein ACH3X2_006461 [Trebouxia sp. C0005]